jgi:transcription-repair coupling factor (superfamily II helicase)
MTSLKPGNFVVHVDHGLARFDGIIRRDMGENFGGIREYLKLCYAENDKLFVPVESAEKITKFIGDEYPKLTRLGSTEWATSQRKLKAEAERIAKDLLKLYAARELSKGKKFALDDEMLKDFCDGFPYELTPGQSQAWNDVRRDMESPNPMDRLVCGDVGFGKTEIAMRAAFKCFRSGMQAAILAPITILAEQHFQTFKKRIEKKNYDVRVELLSRFQTSADQKRILKDIKLGLVDIVVGTHRILSDDIGFQNLGLLVIDEEQRFGVKQKEKLKKLRASMDILTMTATPIPRTLNMSLNKLKDISTITTPPPGRLPVVTEVRKYNLNLIRERILFELERGGQVYFLHNRVQTIEAQTTQLRSLIPEAQFIVAHGQLSTNELEQRIRKFKEGKANVLVASTIIENGIDLPNANTLIVNRAEKFGLSQLYQLRGRVGRRRIQAYAYFLYQGQKLELEAKKRLRAIVEASELGSGFQIAMRDLEIRGAGEVLGVSQAGAIKTVGISHFMRLLHKTIEEMKSGEITTEIKEEENITVEIPLSAYIPSSFIPRADEKIQVYKELASAENKEQLNELYHELREDYGTLPIEVENLCKVLTLKMSLRQSNISGIKISQSSHKSYEVVLRMGREFTPDQVFGLVQNSKYKWVITANALKLSFPSLPVTWYEDLVKEVKWLGKKKK